MTSSKSEAAVIIKRDRDGASSYGSHAAAVTFWLLRHGDAPFDANGARDPNPPLSELGWRQSRAAGTRLRRHNFTHIVASPLLRSRETIESLGALGVAAEEVDWLSEITYP